MSQSFRQFKLTSKIQAKNQHKSSLPDIDPMHTTKNKFIQPSTKKQQLQNARKIHRQNLPVSDFNDRQVRAQIINQKMTENHHEHLNNHVKGLPKNSSISIDKQVDTATSIHPEEDMSLKQTEIKETQLKGLDMWALNKNLKQFSKTRKVAFFKPKIEKITRQNSSTMSKNKTQQIKSMYKIYGGNVKSARDGQRDKSDTDLRLKRVNEHINRRKQSKIDIHPYSTISRPKMASRLDSTLYGTLPLRKQSSDQNSTFYKRENKILSQTKIKASQTIHSDINPYLKTFVNGSHLKRQPSNRNIQILELKNFTPKAVDNTKPVQKNNDKKPTNFRRNRFQKILSDENSSRQNDKLQSNQHLVSEESKKQEKNDREQLGLISRQNISATLPESKNQDAKAKQAEEKKRQYEYNKSIQKISRNFLKNTDDYMDNYQTFSSMPSSKIQFFIDSLTHPEFHGDTTQYKSSYRGQDLNKVGDNFSFTETNDSMIKQKGKKSNQSKPKSTRKHK